MTRDDAAHALLQECGRAYSTFAKGEDLATDQTIAMYRDPDSQRKYVHMYFAKHVTLWKRIRAAVGHRDAPLWSIGAGPMLDLFGWFWDSPSSGSRVVACDAVPWMPLRDCEPWKALAEATVRTFDYRDSVAVPDPALLPQCADLTLTALPSNEIEDEATVLMPFLLNHFLGRNSPTGSEGREAFRGWVADIVNRGGRVIVTDLPAQRAAGFWSDLTGLLGIAATAKDYVFFGSIQEAAMLYPDLADVRSRRGSAYMSNAAVLVIEQAGGTFL